MQSGLPSTPAQTGLIQRVVGEELARFRAEFDVQPMPVPQELRSGLVAWVATFMPEAIGPAEQRSIELTCRASRDAGDFLDHGWFRTIYLDVAMFALTGEAIWLDVLLGNLDHHARALRTFLPPPLALVAERVPFDHPQVVPRIERNLRVWHLGNDALLGVFLMMRGPHERKRELLRGWHEGLKLSPQDAHAIDRALRYGRCGRETLLAEVALLQAYLLCRLVDPGVHPTRSDPQLRLSVNLDAMWSRMVAHPLLKG